MRRNRREHKAVVRMRSCESEISLEPSASVVYPETILEEEKEEEEKEEEEEEEEGEGEGEDKKKDLELSSSSSPKMSMKINNVDSDVGPSRICHALMNTAVLSMQYHRRLCRINGPVRNNPLRATDIIRASSYSSASCKINRAVRNKPLRAKDIETSFVNIETPLTSSAIKDISIQMPHSKSYSVSFINNRDTTLGNTEADSNSSTSARDDCAQLVLSTNCASYLNSPNNTETIDANSSFLTTADKNISIQMNHSIKCGHLTNNSDDD